MKFHRIYCIRLSSTSLLEEFKHLRDRMRICVYLWSTYSTSRALTALDEQTQIHTHTLISARIRDARINKQSSILKIPTIEPTKLSYSQKNQVEKSNTNQINNN